MATLTAQDASNGLADVQFSAADVAGDEMPSGAFAGGWRLAIVLLVTNGDTVAHTVTISPPGALADIEVVVPVGATAFVPVAQQILGAPVSITYDAVTSVTVAVVGL